MLRLPLLALLPLRLGLLLVLPLLVDGGGCPGYMGKSMIPCQRGRATKRTSAFFSHGSTTIRTIGTTLAREAASSAGGGTAADHCSGITCSACSCSDHRTAAGG